MTRKAFLVLGPPVLMAILLVATAAYAVHWELAAAAAEVKPAPPKAPHVSAAPTIPAGAGTSTTELGPDPRDLPAAPGQETDVGPSVPTRYDIAREISNVAPPGWLGSLGKLLGLLYVLAVFTNTWLPWPPQTSKWWRARVLLAQWCVVNHGGLSWPGQKMGPRCQPLPKKEPPPPPKEAA